MAQVIQVAKADELSTKICQALGIDPGMVARLIVDLQVHEPAMVHVQFVGSVKLLDLDWGGLLEGADIGLVEAPAPVIPPYDGKPLSAD